MTRASAARKISVPPPALIWCGILAAVFIAAAALKSANPQDFVRTVSGVAWISHPWSTFFATLVVAWEVSLAVMLVLPASRRIGLTATLVTLCLFVAVLVRIAVSPDTPGCGCLGGFRTTGESRSDAFVGMFRNACMAWIAFHALRGVPSRANASPLAPVTRSHGSRRAAFTLIEILVSIAIVAVLIGVLVPVLASARQNAKVTISLATHAQLSAATSMYAERNKEFYPYFATPGNPLGPKVIDGFDVPGHYFRAQSWHWASLIIPEYFSQRGAIEARDINGVPVSTPGSPESVVRSRFFLTHNAFAASAYWADPEPDDAALFRGVTFADVRFPSLKGLTLDVSIGQPTAEEGIKPKPNGTSVGLADGSARLATLDLSGLAGMARPHGVLRWPVMATEAGMAGRDF